MNTFQIKTPTKVINSEIFRKETGCYLYIEQDEFYISGADSQKHAEELLASHNPIDSQALETSKKAALLDRLGLTPEEVKLLLS